MKSIVRVSVLAFSAALATGCVTPQKKADDKAAQAQAAVRDPGQNKENDKGQPAQAVAREASAKSTARPSAQATPSTASSLPAQARCSQAKWLGEEWGGRIAYAGGDCDNFGKPTGMATVLLNPTVPGNMPSGDTYLVEGLFVDGKAVPGTQYTVRAQTTRGLASGSMTCTNLWHQAGQPLTGKEDTQCQFSFTTKDMYKSRNGKPTAAQRSAGTFTGPVIVTPPRSGSSWGAKFSGAQGTLRVDDPFAWSLFEALNAQMVRNARGGQLNNLVSAIERSKLPPISALTLKGQAGAINAYHGLAGSWKGDVEFTMGGETLTAKNLALNANASTSGNGEFSFCGDNPSVTLVDRAGQSLELQLTIQKSGAGTDCYLTGFALSNGARLKASASGHTEKGWRDFVRSGFYLAGASASSPSEFRFGPLQVMPIWGTVTWPDGRVFDGRFENGKPLGQ